LIHSAQSRNLCTTWLNHSGRGDGSAQARRTCLGRGSSGFGLIALRFSISCTLFDPPFEYSGCHASHRNLSPRYSTLESYQVRLPRASSMSTLGHGALTPTFVPSDSFAQRTIVVENRCDYTVYPAVSPFPGNEEAYTGEPGWESPAGKKHSITVPSTWSGRICKLYSLVCRVEEEDATDSLSIRTNRGETRMHDRFERLTRLCRRRMSRRIGLRGVSPRRINGSRTSLEIEHKRPIRREFGLSSPVENQEADLVWLPS
jgi:hypothetical protein